MLGDFVAFVFVVVIDVKNDVKLFVGLGEVDGLEGFEVSLDVGDFVFTDVIADTVMEKNIRHNYCNIFFSKIEYGRYY